MYSTTIAKEDVTRLGGSENENPFKTVSRWKMVSPINMARGKTV
jgi:hypothetical protein